MVVIVSKTDWTNVMTAIGTVAVAIAAVGIALFTEWRLGRRASNERSYANSKLENERQYAEARLENERQRARDREQLAEAYAVQVTATVGKYGLLGSFADQDTAAECPVVIVVNNGHYTITGIQAWFRAADVDLVSPYRPRGSNVMSPERAQHYSAFDTLPVMLKDGLIAAGQADSHDYSLTPADAGVRFIGTVTRREFLVASYPIVWWTDRWGTRWQHMTGEVSKIDDDTKQFPD